jgi:hypothetical protein
MPAGRVGARRAGLGRTPRPILARGRFARRRPVAPSLRVGVVLTEHRRAVNSSGRGRRARRPDRPARNVLAPTITRVLRTVGAVIGGYLLFALSAAALFQLSGRDPHAPQPLWFMLASVGYGMVFAGLGGAAAARLAPTRPLLHAVGVAAVLALGAGVSLVFSPAAGATWSQWTALTLMSPSAYLGGLLATRSERAGSLGGTTE